MRARSPEPVIVGLDLSPGRIKLVALKAGGAGGGPVVVAAADEALPAPAGGDARRFDADLVGAQVAAVLQRLRLRPASVSLALGPAEAVARRLTVVEQSREITLKALSLQLGQALGADVRKPRVDYARLENDAGGRVAVFAGAARAEAVLAQQRALRATGAPRGAVTAAAAALINAWRIAGDADEPARPVVLLHVGRTAAVWIILAGGRPVAMDAPLVGVHSQRDRIGRAGGHEEEITSLPEAALREWAARIRQEVQRGLQLARRETAGMDADAAVVWVSGGGTAIPGLADALEGITAAPVRVFDPLAALASEPETIEGVHGPALVPALGAALQDFFSSDGAGAAEGELLRLDLGAETEAGTAARGRLPAGTILREMLRDGGFRAVAAGAVALWVGSQVAMQALAAREEDLARRAVQVASDSTAVAAVMVRHEELESRRRAVGEQIGAVRALDASRYAWPKLLHGIGGALPRAAWITDVADGGGGAGVAFRIRGFAASDAVAGAFARGLVSRGVASDARVVRTSAVKIGRFALIQFEVSGIAGGAEAGGPPRGGEG